MKVRLAGSIAAVLWSCFSPPPAAADNYPRQPGVDVQHYVFRVSLSDTGDEIAGETTATIRFVRAGIDRVTLDLASAANGKGMSVSEVTVDAAAAPFSHRMDRLEITL